MPAVRSRILAVAGLLALAALVLAGAALAGNGGFAPVPPQSPNAARISTTYWFIFGFAAFIFILVEAALVIFIVRFRSRGRGREVEGAQVHGHLSLELLWTAVPVLMLAAIAIFVFIKLPGIDDVPAAGASGSQVRIHVEGRQFYWQFTYPNGVIGIDNMRVPVGRPVRVEVTSPVDDVIHSWWIPALAGKIDAIPGHPNHTWFEVHKPGTFTGQCAEFCGIQHAAMRASVTAVPADEFDRWLAQQSTAQASGKSDLGMQEFDGVCAKCHGLSGQGGIGPPIANSAVIQNKDSLDTLVENGKGLMPAVGEGWTTIQLDALYSYLQKRFGHGG